MAKYSRKTREQAYRRSNGRLEEPAGGRRHRTQDDREQAKQGRNFSNQPAGARTPHQQTPTPEKRTQNRNFDLKKEHHGRTMNAERIAAAAAAAAGNRIGGFTSSCPMPAQASTGWTTPRPEQPQRPPRSHASNRRPPLLLPLLVPQSCAHSVPCNLGVSLYRSTIWADETENRSHGAEVLAKSDSENREERGDGESTAMAEGSRA